MKKNEGYAIHELIILFALLGIVFAFSIMKISYAYQEASNEDMMSKEQTNSLKIAAEVYASAHQDELKTDGENFLFGKDLIDKGYLIQTDDSDISKTKIKVTYSKEEKKYLAEIMN